MSWRGGGVLPWRPGGVGGGEQGRNPNGEKLPRSFFPAEGRAASPGGRRSEPGEKGLGEQPCALAGAAPPAEPASGGRAGPAAARGCPRGEPP